MSNIELSLVKVKLYSKYSKKSKMNSAAKLVNNKIVFVNLFLSIK